MKIGNVVSTTKVVVPEYFNVVRTKEEIIEGLPTLIVGWEYTKKNFPNYDITNIVIDTNLYWTTKIIEDRDKHETDVQWFIQKTYNDLIAKLTYVFVDPLQYSTKALYKIIRKIKTVTEATSYVHGDMIYIYGDGLIFGVDLKLLKYVGLNTDKIKNKIKHLSKNFIETSTGLEKHIEWVNNEIKYVPFFHTIENVSK